VRLLLSVCGQQGGQICLGRLAVVPRLGTGALRATLRGQPWSALPGARVRCAT